MASRPLRRPRRGESEVRVPIRYSWVRVVWAYGFPLVFAIIALVYGLYFGNQIIKTQREGIESISHIQEIEAQQTVILGRMNDRLERIERAVEQP